MLQVRFRIRTIMIATAVTAVLMGLLRCFPPIFFVLMMLVVHLCLLVLIFFLALVGPIALFAVGDWLIRMGCRLFPRGQSRIPKTGIEPKRGVQERVG